MEFSRQEYWSRLPLPTPGELPNLGNEPAYLASPILAGGFFAAEPPGKLKQHQWRSNCLMRFLWCDMVDHTLKVTQGRCVTDLITAVGDCGWVQQGALWGSTLNALPNCPFLKVGLLRHTQDYPEGVNFPCPLLWLQEHCPENEPSEKALRQKNSMSYDCCLRVPIPHHPLVSPNRPWVLYSQTQFILFFLSFLIVGVLYEMSKRNTLVNSQRRKGLEKSLGI